MSRNITAAIRWLSSTSKILYIKDWEADDIHIYIYIYIYICRAASPLNSQMATKMVGGGGI